MTILNPRVDFAFKKLFGSEGSQDILISFINAIIVPSSPITQVTLLNPLNYKETPADKFSILDIKASDEKGHRYNIEMQVTDQVYYNQRALYYWSKLYTSQLQAGNNFDVLNKTISINILNFNYFHDEPDYHNIFRILNVRSHKAYFEDLELHFIELKKFNKEISHLQTTLDRWITFLQKADRYNNKTLPTELKQEAAINKAMQTLETLYLDEEELEIYEARLKWLRDEAAAIQKAELKGEAKGMAKGIAKGMAEGVAKGMAEGIAKGIVEGKAEGIAEGKAQGIEQVAKNLLRQGMSIEAIIAATGLSFSAIEAINSAEKVN